MFLTSASKFPMVKFLTSAQKTTARHQCENPHDVNEPRDAPSVVTPSPSVCMQNAGMTGRSIVDGVYCGNVVVTPFETHLRGCFASHSTRRCARHLRHQSFARPSFPRVGAFIPGSLSASYVSAPKTNGTVPSLRIWMTFADASCVPFDAVSHWLQWMRR